MLRIEFFLRVNKVTKSLKKKNLENIDVADTKGVEKKEEDITFAAIKYIVNALKRLTF